MATLCDEFRPERLDSTRPLKASICRSRAGHYTATLWQDGHRSQPVMKRSLIASLPMARQIVAEARAALEMGK
jgi:hypothetical protein